MRKALFAGTFDPPTLGHLDIIERSQTFCDNLIIGIAENTVKKQQPLFSQKKRLEMLKKITKHLKFLEICIIPGLVCDFVKKHQIQFLIRAIRSPNDMDYELSLAEINRKLCQIETLFLPAQSQFAFIQSSHLKELLLNKGPIGQFVPKEIKQDILDHFKK